MMLLPQPARELMYLHIDSFKQGQYWRFFTGHFIHYSWIHCISNVVGLLLLSGIFHHTKQATNWILVLLITIVVISTCLILFSNQLEWYVGFSGVLTGMYAYASIKTFKENAGVSALLFIALFTYVALQTLEGELVSSVLMSDLKTSSYAHAYGLIAGGLYAVIEKFYLAIYQKENY
tara:strand:- start:78 stop:608 length:531 start_codon:yes stop_codon:yes gene_type:complete